MRYKAFGESLPGIKVEAETANEAIEEARKINTGYVGVTPLGQSPQARYNKKNTRQFVVKLNYKTDPDILEMLENEPNKQGLLKRLLYEEYERRNS